MIGIIDIAMGNLRSVSNAVLALGHTPKIVREATDFEDVTHLILPGVGSYGTAMLHMREQGLVEPIRALAGSGKPVLGICLGMQLLSSTGDEGGPADGLALVPGRVIRFEDDAVPAIPHIGWNEVKLLRKHPVFAKTKSGVDFYFVHSFHFVCADEQDRWGSVEYGGRDYTSIIGRANVLGFQFHPEKSQSNGLRLLENFCDWDGAC